MDPRLQGAAHTARRGSLSQLFAYLPEAALVLVPPCRSGSCQDSGETSLPPGRFRSGVYPDFMAYEGPVGTDAWFLNSGVNEEP